MDKEDESQQQDSGAADTKAVPATEKDHRLAEIRKGAEGILFDPGEPAPDPFQEYEPPSEQPTQAPSEMSPVQDSSPPADSGDTSGDS